MADIFVSYAREDYAAAAALAELLQNKGWTVWWDREIQVGRSFARVIEQELERARCVVVLWSSASIESDWVLAEASEGADRRILVPARLGAVRLPLQFRGLHTADLLNWHDGLQDRGVSDCLKAVSELLRPAAPTSAPEPEHSERRQDPLVTATQQEQIHGDDDTFNGIRQDVINESATPVMHNGRSDDGYSITGYVPWISTFVLGLLWLAGMTLHVGGALIHILLLIAIILIVIRVVRVTAERRARAL